MSLPTSAERHQLAREFFVKFVDGYCYTLSLYVSKSHPRHATLSVPFPAIYTTFNSSAMQLIVLIALFLAPTSPAGSVQSVGFHRYARRQAFRPLS